MEYSNRIAVIGCGAWGANHVRVLSELGVLAAIVEPDPDRGAELSANFDVPLVTLEDLWAGQTIQAVVIATPAFTHYEIAMHALNAGKDVLVEKPMALNVLDAENLLLQAEAKNRVLMVGHLLRYHPAFLTLQKEIANGRLGKLRYIYSNRLSFGKFRREENILWSFAPHDISMILAIIKSAPNRVYAECAKFLHRDIADSTTTFLTFPGGEHAHIFVSWLHPYKDQRLVVIGEDGMMSFDDSASWDEKISLYMHKIDWKDQVPTPNKADMTFLPVENIEEPLISQARHFIDCINTGATPHTSGREGLDVLRILDAAEKSMNSGLPVCPQDFDRNVPGADVHESSIIDVDVEIGVGTKIWHFSHVFSQARIGNNCVLGQNVMVGKGVKIGDRCKIQNNVSIYQGVTLEDGVFCGPSCVFTNVLTPRAEIERKDEFSSTLVKRGVTIGANATIVCGNTIGQYAMIGAGAVVTSDVPDYALMTGVPARRTGWVSEAGEVLDENMTCPRTGQQYRQVDETTLQKI